MNLDNLIGIAVSIVISAAAVGRLDSLQRWIWIAQAKVAYESRASNWGSPKFFRIPDGDEGRCKKRKSGDVSCPGPGNRLKIPPLFQQVICRQNHGKVGLETEIGDTEIDVQRVASKEINL